MSLKIKLPPPKPSKQKLPRCSINLETLEQIFLNRSGDTILCNRCTKKCYKKGSSNEIQHEIDVYSEISNFKNIINPLGIYSQLHNNILYYVIELPLYKMDLLDYMVQNLGTVELQTNLTEHTIVFLVKQILAGLNALHNAGIIHHDIKPDNIVIDEHCNLVITDFGSAYSPNCKIDNDGTLSYCPPEFLQSRIVTDKYDIWGCGAILYCMLYGMSLWYPDMEYHYYKEVVVNNEIIFYKKRYPILSELCRELLTKDYKQRITADAAQQYINILYPDFDSDFDCLCGI